MGALSQARAHATVAVSDHDRGKAFYRDKLGLRVVQDGVGATTFECADGTLLDVYPSRYAGTAKSTVASFEVPDLDGAMADLRGRGITFEEIEEGDIKTSNGVAELGGVRGAWFKDPDGNTLALVQLS